MVRLGLLFVTLFSIVLSIGESRAGGLASMRFQNGLVNGLVDMDQKSLHYCDGSLRGLTDIHGREILAAKYADIEYCGNGIFLATDVNRQHRLKFGRTRHFFNSEGKELLYSLPPDSYLLNAFWFGEKAAADPNLKLVDLPSEALLLFDVVDGRQGLCDKAGKVLIPLLHGTILYYKPGFAFINYDGRGDAGNTIVNLHTLETAPAGFSYDPGVNPPVRNPQANLGIPLKLPQDRTLRKVATDDGRFDPEYWLENREYPIAHIEMFDRFLAQYNLIGMSREQVVGLLGKPGNSARSTADSDCLVYGFPTQGCLRYFYGVRIYLSSGKVTGWSFAYREPMGTSEKQSELVTTNVRLQLKPPRIGMGQTFPTTILKQNGR
jgi:hypothetical protein